MKQKQFVTGEQLVDDFRTAMIIRSTAAYAADEATRSEQETISSLDAMSRGAYLNPATLSETAQTSIARASVDAHLKKVQAQQINQQSNLQMADLVAGSTKYIDKKVTITVLDRASKPIESIWYNPHTNQYYSGILNTKSISGTIHEIMFDKNTLVLKPTLLSRLTTPKRHFFMIYITNPTTLDPFISIKI